MICVIIFVIKKKSLYKRISPPVPFFNPPMDVLAIVYRTDNGNEEGYV